MPVTKFLIISSQRSGSTLIRTLLDSHPGIRCYGEVFLPTYRKEHSFYEYLNTRGYPKVLALLLRGLIVRDFLNCLYGTNDKDAVGFKIMYDQIRYRPYRFPMVLDYMQKNDVKVMHLIRENSFRVCLSRQFARATRTYHTNETRVQPTLRIDIQLLLDEIKRLEQQKLWCRSIIKGLNAIEVSYEEFVANKDTESSRILNFLGVDDSVELQSPLRKVLTAPIRDAVINYEELESEMKKGGYAHFLAEVRSPDQN